MHVRVNGQICSRQNGLNYLSCTSDVVDELMIAIPLGIVYLFVIV